MTGRRGAPGVGPAICAAVMALVAFGCAPETITLLSASDGGQRARDLAIEQDESSRLQDAAPDVDRPTDAGCPMDTEDYDSEAGCSDRGPGDTLGNMDADAMALDAGSDD